MSLHSWQDGRVSTYILSKGRRVTLSLTADVLIDTCCYSPLCWSLGSVTHCGAKRLTLTLTTVVLVPWCSGSVAHCCCAGWLAFWLTAVVLVTCVGACVCLCWTLALCCVCCPAQSMLVGWLCVSLCAVVAWVFAVVLVIRLLYSMLCCWLRGSAVVPWHWWPGAVPAVPGSIAVVS